MEKKILPYIILFISSPLLGQQSQSYDISNTTANYLFAFYGILAFTAIVSFIQFWVSRDKAYLYYSFYVGVGFFFYAFWQEANFNYLTGRRALFRDRGLALCHSSFTDHLYPVLLFCDRFS